MGGLYGVEKLKQVFGVLIGGGVLLKDAMGKKYVALFSDMLTLAALLKTGVDLSAAGQEAAELDGEDKASLLAYMREKLPDVADAELQKKIEDGATLLMEAGDHAKSLIAFEQKVEAYVKGL